MEPQRTPKVPRWGWPAPLKKRIADVKLAELTYWVLMRDFTSKGIARAFQRGCSRYYKSSEVKKGSLASVFMVLATYVLFNL